MSWRLEKLHSLDLYTVTDGTHRLPGGLTLKEGAWWRDYLNEMTPGDGVQVLSAEGANKLAEPTPAGLARLEMIERLARCLEELAIAYSERSRSFHDYIRTMNEPGSNLHYEVFDRCIHPDCRAVRDLLVRVGTDWNSNSKGA